MHGLRYGRTLSREFSIILLAYTCILSMHQTDIDMSSVTGIDKEKEVLAPATAFSRPTTLNFPALGLVSFFPSNQG